jgi:hypothetical protein
MLRSVMGRSTLLVLAAIPCIVSALRIPQHTSPDFLRRDLVTLEGCPEHKEFATPYNEDSSGYLFSGMYVAGTAIDADADADEIAT